MTRTGSPELGIRGTWRAAALPVKAVIAGMLINRLGGFLQVFLVLYLIDRGYSAGQAGAALGANGVGAIAGVLVGGWLTARLGARTTIVAAMTATAVLIATFPYVDGFPAMVALVVAVGVTSQVYRPASAEVVSRLIPEHGQVMVFAMYRLATNIGTAAAPLIGVGLAAISYEVLFWGEAVAALGCAVVVLVALRDMADDRSVEASGRPGPRASYLALARDGRFLMFLFGILAYAAVYSQYLSTLPLTVRADGLSEAVYGILVSVNAVIVIACELLVTKYVQRWPTRVAVFTGTVLVGLGVAMYALPFGVIGFLLATVVWSLGETVSAPSLVAYPAQASSSAELRSRYLGSSQAAYGVGSAAGPALGPALWSGIGDAVWLVNGAAALAAAIAAATGVRRRRT